MLGPTMQTALPVHPFLGSLYQNLQRHTCRNPQLGRPAQARKWQVLILSLAWLLSSQKPALANVLALISRGTPAPTAR